VDAGDETDHGGLIRQGSVQHRLRRFDAHGQIPQFREQLCRDLSGDPDLI